MTESLSDLTDHSDLEALSILVNYRRWIIDSFAPYLRGRTVEYGAGIGSIGAEVLRHVDELQMVEPIEQLFLKLAEKFTTPNVKLENASLETSVRASADAQYDTIVMVNVLEHIAQDSAALIELHRVLRPMGHLCIFVPAFAFLFSDYDRLVGHYRRYDLKSLRAKVTDAGFEIRRATYFDAIGIAPWWISMKLLRQTRIRPGLAEIYDRCVVPVERILESLIAPPFGKNIVLIARKP